MRTYNIIHMVFWSAFILCISSFKSYAMDGDQKEDNLDLPVRTVNLKKTSPSSDKDPTMQTEFCRACKSNLIIFYDPKNTPPKCGLPEAIKEPFLDICRLLTFGLKDEDGILELIDAVSNYSINQLNVFINKPTGNKSSFCTAWHSLISENTPAKVRKEILQFLVNVKVENLNLLLNLNALIEYSGGGEPEKIELAELIANLPENHQLVVDHYSPITNDSKLSPQQKMYFLQAISNAKPQDVNNIIEEASLASEWVIIDGK